MSKLMNDLSNLNNSRKVHEDIIIEDEQIEKTDQTSVVHEHKGFYFISFLAILLIAISALSMSASLKSLDQLEASWIDTKVVSENLRSQQESIKALQAAMALQNSQEMVLIDNLKDQMKELQANNKMRAEKILKMSSNYREASTTMKDSIDELKSSDRLMLKKYISLNEKIQKLEEINSLFLNSY